MFNLFSESFLVYLNNLLPVVPHPCPPNTPPSGELKLRIEEDEPHPPHKVPRLPMDTKTGAPRQPRSRSPCQCPFSRTNHPALIILDSTATYFKVIGKACPLHPATTHHITRRASGPFEAPGVTSGLCASRSYHYPGCYISASHSQPTHLKSSQAPQQVHCTNLCHHLLCPPAQATGAYNVFVCTGNDRKPLHSNGGENSQAIISWSPTLMQPHLC